jgi:hypothetical protein
MEVMAESLITKHLRDGTLRAVSGANTYTWKYEDGDFKLAIPGPTVEHYLDRGRLADTNGGKPNLRFGEDQPMTGSFSCYLRDLGSSLILTASQFVTKTGIVAASWASTMGATDEVPTVDLYWDVAGVVHGDGANRTLYLPYTYISGATEEGKPNKVTFDFTSYCVYPVIT